jgi:hypothetical protein
MREQYFTLMLYYQGLALKAASMLEARRLWELSSQYRALAHSTNS